MQLRCDRRCDAFLTRAEGVHYRPKVDITHAVRITFRKERITQRNLICQVDKSGFFVGDPYGNRTHVTAVKGRCLNRLTNGPGSGNLIRTDDIPGMNRML